MGLFHRKHDSVTKVIDLRDPAAVGPAWGTPISCPVCSGRGYLDHVDPFREIMFMHCTRCYARYERTKIEIDLLRRGTEAFTV